MYQEPLNEPSKNQRKSLADTGLRDWLFLQAVNLVWVGFVAMVIGIGGAIYEFFVGYRADPASYVPSLIRDGCALGFGIIAMSCGLLGISKSPHLLAVTSKPKNATKRRASGKR